jgi:hypothetical protein
MSINHATTIPSGTPMDTSEGAPPSPTQQNPWLCSFACTAPGHSDTVNLVWIDPASVNRADIPGADFIWPDAESNDPADLEVISIREEGGGKLFKEVFDGCFRLCK